MIHKTLANSSLSITGLRTARVIFSDESIDRCGDKVIQSGIDFREYMRNAICLLFHDGSKPGGTVSDIRLAASGSTCLITMAAPGVSQHVDEAWRLIQAGILKVV